MKKHIITGLIQLAVLVSSCINNNTASNFIQKLNNVVEIKIYLQRGSITISDKNEIKYFLSTFGSHRKNSAIPNISDFKKNGSIHFINENHSIQVVDIDTEINCYCIKIDDINYYELLTYRTSRYIAEI